jgi:hypothetical protein
VEFEPIPGIPQLGGDGIGRNCREFREFHPIPEFQELLPILEFHGIPGINSNSGIARNSGNDFQFRNCTEFHQIPEFQELLPIPELHGIPGT